MTTATLLQMGLLIGNTALLAAMLVLGWRHKSLRPWAFAVGFLSAIHAAYYYFFLIQPGVLGAYATMMFSIGLRYVVLFLSVLVMVLVKMSDRWRM
jgi:hypothetical protein